MKKTLDDLYDNFYNKINLDEEIDFKVTNKCNDWRNYIGDFEDIWESLTLREKKIMYMYCCLLADQEDWD